MNSDATNGSSEQTDCHPLQTTDYMDLLWTTLAEFPGIFATIFIIEKCGRKKTMAFQFLLYAGCVIMLTATTEYVIAFSFQSSLFSLIVFIYFSRKSNNIDNYSFHGSWRHCWPLPSGLCLYAGGVSDSVTIGRRWWVFGAGTLRRHGHAVRGASAAANIGHECSHRLWYFCCICMRCMPFAAVRDERHRYGFMNVVRSTRQNSVRFHRSIRLRLKIAYYLLT